MTEPASRPSIKIGNPARVLAELIEYVGVCVKLLDLDGRVLSWNGGCELIYGWKAHEVLGKVLPHVPVERRASALDFVRSVAASGSIAEQAVVAVDSEGWRHNLVLTAIPVTDEDGHVAAVLTISKDALSGERGETVGDEASELITRMFGEPIGAIANAASLLSRHEVAEDSGRRGPLIARIADLSQEARDSLDDLRIAAGDVDGMVAHDSERVDMGTMVAEIAAAIGADAQRVLVDFAVGTALVDVDRARVSRAVRFMLREAIAGARTGSPVHVSVRKVGPTVAVETRYRGKMAGVLLSSTATGAETQGRKGGVAEAWSGLRYADAVARAHRGRATITSGDNGAVALIFALPSGGIGSPKGAVFRDRV